MASAVQSMRLCLRAASRSRRAAIPATIAPRPGLRIRPFSSTPIQQRPPAKNDDNELDEDLEDEYEDDDDFDPIEAQRQLRELRQDSSNEKAWQMHERAVNEINSTFVEAEKMRFPRKAANQFWGEDEEDPDMIVDESNDDAVDEEDIMSMAHAKFEEYREYREYARIAAWQMPLLSKLAVPFEPPTAQEPLRFRYTSYMGEFHPAEQKVVVEFCPKDLPLDEAQQQKIRKLLGPRWNPETDIAKMSCELFDHPAQNKRYLGNLVNKLVARAKDPTDMFEDIPLDTRHHTFKVKPKFPKEWRMTEERRQFLEDTREKALLLDKTKEEAGTLVDGEAKINLSFNPPRAAFKPEMAHVRVGHSLSSSLFRRQQPNVRR
ncbi:mitochondrial ribosomal subunit protein-domain-containing protein [Nemania sp. FL0031]|nr:mitochondrial ribosomal subunit protein-domain-containing protein [Nemania sp. FL0031]